MQDREPTERRCTRSTPPMAQCPQPPHGPPCASQPVRCGCALPARGRRVDGAFTARRENRRRRGRGAPTAAVAHSDCSGTSGWSRAHEACALERPSSKAPCSARQTTHNATPPPSPRVPDRSASRARSGALKAVSTAANGCSTFSASPLRCIRQRSRARSIAHMHVCAWALPAGEVGVHAPLGMVGGCNEERYGEGSNRGGRGGGAA